MLLLLMRLQVEMSLLAIQVQTATSLEHKMGTTVQALLPKVGVCCEVEGVFYFLTKKMFVKNIPGGKRRKRGEKPKKLKKSLTVVISIYL